ncbi:protein of unknown function [Candidatus Filomicrobium marinum]|nr:protein of unknown function [Candidatus Filomicrobium marinum]
MHAAPKRILPQADLLQHRGRQAGVTLTADMGRAGQSNIGGIEAIVFRRPRFYQRQTLDRLDG